MLWRKKRHSDEQEVCAVRLNVTTCRRGDDKSVFAQMAGLSANGGSAGVVCLLAALTARRSSSWRLRLSITSTFHIMKNCSSCVSSCVPNVEERRGLWGPPCSGSINAVAHAEKKYMKNKERRAAAGPSGTRSVFSLRAALSGFTSKCFQSEPRAAVRAAP